MKFKVGDKVRCIKLLGELEEPMQLDEEFIVQLSTDKMFTFENGIYKEEFMPIIIFKKPLIYKEKLYPGLWIEPYKEHFELVESYKYEESDVQEEKGDTFDPATDTWTRYYSGLFKNPTYENLKRANVNPEDIARSVRDWQRTFGPDPSRDGLIVSKEEYNKQLKAEDLKVGMVFEINDNYGSIPRKWYSKIYKITEHKVHYDYIEISDINPHFSCSNCSKEEFLSPSLNKKLIDKVPSKTVEVEEEVPVYINEFCLMFLKVNGYLSDINLSLDKNEKVIEKPVELCKIKRKVIKTLEFNWDKGVFEGVN